MRILSLASWLTDGSLFSILLTANLRAALAGCVIFLALYFVGRYLSPHIRSLLWLLVFIPLIFPFAPPSPLSLFQILNPAEVGGSPNGADPLQLPLPPTIEFSEDSAPTVVTTASEANAAVDSHFEKLTPRLMLGSLWIAGTFVFLSRFVLQTIKIGRLPHSRQVSHVLVAEIQSCAKELKLSTIPEFIWTSENISPSLGGFLRPKFILPDWILSQVSVHERRLILLHELRHLQSGDLLFHRILSLLVAFHWWNPIARLAHRHWLKERELACDAWVVEHACPRDFKPYAETLLRIIEVTNQHQSLRCSATIGASTSLTEHRIMAMKLQQRTSWTGLLVACGTAALIGAMILTNPLSAQNQERPTSVSSQLHKGDQQETSLNDRQSENNIRIVGNVLLPDGKTPAADAQVIGLTPRTDQIMATSVYLEDGRIYRDPMNEWHWVPTDDAGRFKITTTEERPIAILHPDGFLYIPLAEVQNEKKWILKPWAIFNVDTSQLASNEVARFISRPTDSRHPDEEGFVTNFETTVRAVKDRALVKVQPGQTWIALSVEADAGYGSSTPTSIFLKPGERRPITFKPMSPVERMQATQESRKRYDAPAVTETQIRIVLRLANGNSAGGASVHAKVTPSDGSADREHKLIADARGIAEVPVPESFKELRLWLETRQPGWVPLFAAWPPRNAKADQQVPKELEFVFPKGTRIGGTIQAADGKPIPEAIVVASILPSRFPPERIARGIPQNPSKGEETLARTDANGRWSMGWIPSGDEVRVSLTVIHQDFIGWTYNESDLAAQGITMADLRDESATLVLPRGHRFHGKVLDAKGQPVPNANIVWDRGEKIGEDIASMIETNNYGRFDLGRVPAGKYTLGVSVNDAPRMEKTVQLTNDDAIIFQLTE